MSSDQSCKSNTPFLGARPRAGISGPLSRSHTLVSEAIAAWHRHKLAKDIEKGALDYLEATNQKAPDTISDGEDLNKFEDSEETIKKRLLHGLKENLLALKAGTEEYNKLEKQVFDLAIELGEAVYGPTHYEYEFCKHPYCRYQQ